MPSGSFYFEFRIEKGDPRNLKIPCMIGQFRWNRKRYACICREYVSRHGFTILENIEANIDPSLSQVVFGCPFVEITKLMLDREQGLITFMDGIKEVSFKTSYRDFKMDDLTSEGPDLLSYRVILSEDDYRRGCERASDLVSRIYKDIDKKLGPSYKKEIKGIDFDVSLEAGEIRTNEGVT
nr:hypothetical protein [Tanacetum cinerariifolium]